MGEPPLNVLRSAELKRRGIAMVEDALRAGPVHLLKRNRPAAVVLGTDDYQLPATLGGPTRYSRPLLPGVVAGAAPGGAGHKPRRHRC